jgi:hypothetical protein
VDIFGLEITSAILFLPAEFYDGFGPCAYMVGTHSGLSNRSQRYAVCSFPTGEETQMLGTILIIFIILLLLGSLPAWPYSTGWGYYPSGLFGLILLVLVVMLLFGRL